ncbi:unnamed protein product [Medioppia subpectinata]|uniref:OCEL domain-containing protein n=1 Tax=Medioppia subpectinata TaxID=1979941 RepID=A0A7R9KQ09_9ACAR|nr:unnamed protein product [Medioppia subpectinata]CAG2106538.1 unnamed protein product [Medioppia subpectinata]
MATLVEGQQYALTSHLNHSLNKSLIFVKLTDSALKAIEDYLNHKGSVSSNSKPSIEFRSKDSQGVISIPSKRSTQDEDRQHFSFTLSNVDAVEPQGSFECIRQSKNRFMESFGDIDYKLQIHANDDSYQKTKVKMAVVERENKKNSTKVIKASDPNVGRKVKVKHHRIPSRPVPHSQPQSTPESQPGYSSYNNYNTHHKSNSPPTLKLNGTTINAIPNHKTVVNHNSINTSHPLKKSELINRLSNEGFKDIDKKELNLILDNISLVRDNVYELAKSGWSQVNGDRIDSTADDKELVGKRNALNGSQTSPAQLGISPLSDCGSMPAYSSPMSMDCSSPYGSKSPSIKRSSDSCSASLSVPKKQKPLVNTNQSYNNNTKSTTTKLKTNGYNHLLNGWANKPSSPERQSNSSTVTNADTNAATELKGIESLLTNTSHSSPDSNISCLSQQEFHNPTNRVNYITNDNAFDKSNKRETFNRYKSNGYHTNGNGSGSINSSPNSSPDSGTGSHDGSTLSTSSNLYTICANDETPDFVSKYTKIVTPEQRAQYKKDFYIEYEEYRRLHRNVESVAAKFAELEIRLNTKVEGSEDWNKLMDQIVREYEETKNCPKFQKCRKRMFYLHSKLAHIKTLVVEYDRNYHKEKNRFPHKLQVKSNPIS